MLCPHTTKELKMDDVITTSSNSLQLQLKLDVSCSGQISDLRNQQELEEESTV